jgi:hypothetical protein
VVRCLRQVMLGNNDVARCDFVWRQPRLKRHLPGRLPDNADDSASLRSYVVQLIPESHWLIADRMDSVLLASHSDAPSGSRVHTVDDGNAELAVVPDVAARSRLPTELLQQRAQRVEFGAETRPIPGL